MAVDEQPAGEIEPSATAHVVEEVKSGEKSRPPEIQGRISQIRQGDVVEHNSFCDMSSIMINPDQIYNNFNLLEDEEEAAGNSSPQYQPKKGEIGARKQKSSNL